jgi:hypothetical protein
MSLLSNNQNVSTASLLLLAIYKFQCHYDSPQLGIISGNLTAAPVGTTTRGGINVTISVHLQTNVGVGRSSRARGGTVGIHMNSSNSKPLPPLCLWVLVAQICTGAHLSAGDVCDSAVPLHSIGPSPTTYNAGAD